MDKDRRLVPEPLEIACGTALGAADPGPLPAASAPTLRAAIEEVIRRALERPPCGVSFSGGRDSSAVLALATHVARRDALPLPVPVTLRFPDDAASDERGYQQAVVSHLALPEWQRIELTDELDVVGPLASSVLHRHGVTVPFNVYFHDPVLRSVRGGSLLTGVGGDELLRAGIHHRANLVLQRRERVRPLDAARVAVAVSPQPVRRVAAAAWLRHDLDPLPWLRPAAMRQVRRDWVAGLGLDSLSFAASVRRVLWHDRSRLLGLHGLDVLGRDHEVLCCSPFSDAEVLSTAATVQGWRDFPSRRAATSQLAGDLLPPEVARRPTKATFSHTFFNRHAAQFAARWDGTLPDELAELADGAVLQAMWRDEAEQSDARSFGLLQAAYLAQSEDGRST